MPRSNRPRRGGRPRRVGDRETEQRADAALGGGRRVENRADGSWVVTPVRGDATKSYRCPGCDQEIRPGVAHLVVWSADPLGALGGLEDRRHWHIPCWQARGRRGRG